jgi:hypothetical protein
MLTWKGLSGMRIEELAVCQSLEAFCTFGSAGKVFWETVIQIVMLWRQTHSPSDTGT